MRTPEHIRKCVAFVAYASPKDGSLVPVGSVFFLGRDSSRDDGLADPVYAVTARHVIDGLRSKGIHEVYVSMNMKEGDRTRGFARSDINDWFMHPTDESIDVAVRKMGVPAECDHQVFPMSRCLTAEKIDEEEVGLGDEVSITGLFRHHTGKERNIPIIRVGNLAAMDEEPVYTREYGYIQAYLIEARSIGGLSGSPVILNLGHVRSVGGQVKHYNARDPIFYLLGLIHGHYDADANLIDGDSETIDANELSNEKINTGIAIVVPFYSIISVIEEFEKQE